MDAPRKECAFCTKMINDKGYRSLSSKTSRERYDYIMQQLPKGFNNRENIIVCNLCVNKLNRICKLNDDLKSKLTSIREERDKILSLVMDMPGIKGLTKTTTPRAAKRPLIKTPTPKGKHKRCLFVTPQKQPNARTRSTPVSKQMHTCTTRPVLKCDATTQTVPMDTEDFDVKIAVKYGGKIRSKIMKNDADKAALKACMNSRGPLTIIKAYSKDNGYRDAMLSIVKSKIEKEIRNITRKTDGILQTRPLENTCLLNFDWEKEAQVFEVIAPYFYSILANVVGKKESNLPRLITASTILLYARSQNINCSQYILGLILDQCGLTKEGMKIIHDLGITVSSTSVLNKKKQLIKQQQKKIKETVEPFIRFKEKEKLDVKYQTQGIDLSMESVKTTISHVSDEIGDESVTTTVQACNSHSLHCETEDQTEQEATFRSYDESQFNNNNVQRNVECEKNGTSINEIVKGSEILGDNLDVTITPAKMTADCQRKSLHWFLTMVKEKKITFHDMPKVTHERCQSILELPTTSWIPTSGDIEGFHENLVFHVSHILVKYIDFLKPVACCLPEYIEHSYIEKTKERSVVLNSDLIDASENCAQGMITILQKIHELGVPKLEVGENKRVIERVVFGGRRTHK